MARFRRPSPAFVLALLALIVALSSSAGADPVAVVAKAVNGSSIKKHSIPLSALSPAAIKQLRAAGAPNVTVVTNTCGPAPCTRATATCPAGSHATGGGGVAIGNQLLFESQPSSFTAPTGWDVAGGAASPPAQGTVTAYAVCASP